MTPRLAEPMQIKYPAIFLLALCVAAVACSASSPSESDDSAIAQQDGGVPLEAAIADTSAPPRVYNGPLFMRRAEAGELAAFERDEVEVAENGELVLRTGGGHPGNDPYGPGTYNGGNYYNGGSFRYGTARSTEWISKEPFDNVVPSFEAITPKGTWIAVEVAVRVGGSWFKDYALGVWASSTETVSRHSVDDQKDATAEVKTDTLVIKGEADALRFTVQLFSENGSTPRVRGVAAIISHTKAAPPSDTPTPAALGKMLDVPERSQMVYPGGDVWCSPTSTSMLLAYWAKKLDKPELSEAVPTAADLVYDWIFEGTGNWTFNMAHAASVGGGALHAVVTRLRSLHQVERLIAAEIPVAISVASKSGHLLVVRGFTASGDVVCNDPGYPTDAEVRVTYDRAELESSWQQHSQGTTYLTWPAGTELPVDPLGAF